MENIYKTKKPTYLIIFFLISILFHDAYGQSDNCSGTPQSLNVGTSCEFQNFDVTTNGTNSEEINATCATGTDYADGWWTVVGTGNDLTITVNNCNRDVCLAAFSGCASGQLACSMVSNNNQGSITFASVNGTTYYIQVQRRSGNNNHDLDGDICAITAVPPPVNETCATASQLPCDANLTGTTAGTSNIVHGTGCSMSNYGVWYRFLGNGESNTITSTGTGGFDQEMSIATGVCGALVNVDCIDDNGNNGDETFTFTPTNGVTYFVYIAHRSNGSSTTGDFTITKSCDSPPCDNSEVLLCGTNNLAGTTVGAVNLAHGTGCSMSSRGKWYKFVGTGKITTVSTDAANGFDQEMAIASGTCDNLTNISCQDNDNSGGIETYTFLATIGVDYYIYVADRSNGSNNTGNFTISISCIDPPCESALNLPCGTNNLAATTIGSPNVVHGTGCSLSNHGTWFHFVGDGQMSTITAVSSGGYDHEMAITSGSCGGLTNISCNDNTSGNTEAFSLITTPGLDYYVYIAHRSSNSSTTGNFTISHTCLAPPAPPANDECLTAINVPVDPDATCSAPVSGTLSGASASGFANDCGGTTNDDVWYTFTATSVRLKIDLLNIAPATDLYHSVYVANCAGIGAAIVCSDPNSSIVDGLTIGNTYLVRVYSVSGNLSPAIFEICITTPPQIGACGNELTNDWCDAPALLTKGGANFSSSTYDYYTEDDPSNLDNEFDCGVLDNNSYYEFTASNATEVFDFVSVTNCTEGDGIQAQVYEVAHNGSGCCTNFNSKSNCWSPANDVPGVVTATNLIPGQNYILMVDGWAGDHCNFTVAGWSAVGILLPIELLSFSLENIGNVVELTFETASERDVDFFVIESSRDGKFWQEVENIKAVGNSNSVNSYSAIDESPFIGLSYYRIKDVSTDGVVNYSDIISNEFVSTKYLLYPIPVNKTMFLEGDKLDQAEMHIYNNIGEEIFVERTPFGNKYSFDFENVKNGIYFLKIQSNKTKKTERIVVVHK